MSEKCMDIEPGRMLPAAAYTSEDVLAWELRHLFAAGWTCLGRVEDLLPAGEDDRDAERSASAPCGWVTSAACWCATARPYGMFANTCRHRGHELLPDGGTSQRRSILCPYHAWTYDLSGTLIGAKGFLRGQDGDVRRFRRRRLRPGRAAGAGVGGLRPGARAAPRR